MKILGLDFEATDKTPLTAEITEVGAVHVRVDGLEPRAPRQVLTTLSAFVYDVGSPPLSPEVVKLTKITDGLLKDSGRPEKEVLPKVLYLIQESDYVMAYNKSFDEVLLRKSCEKLLLPVPSTPWLCAFTDIPYDEMYRCKQLSHLAWEHGVDVDRTLLHRATYDVQIMLQLALNYYGLGKIIDYAKDPWVFIQALIPKPWDDGGKGKDQARAQGYGWQTARGTDGPVFDKMWVKRVKGSRVEDEQKKAPFSVRIL